MPKKKSLKAAKAPAQPKKSKASMKPIKDTGAAPAMSTSRADVLYSNLTGKGKKGK